jgi:hypothetical protein
MTAAAATSMFGPYLISNNNNNDDNDNNFNNRNNNNRAFAQQATTPSTISSIPTPSLPVQMPTNKIIITPTFAQFYPLTDPTFNQLKIIVQYTTHDLSLLNARINGILQVSLLNGTIIKTSSFPNGFILNQTGTIPFATSFADKAIQNVTANVVLTDLSKTTEFSNTVTANVNFNNITTAAG